VIFTDNRTEYGGGVFSEHYSSMSFYGNSTRGNIDSLGGGAVNCYENCSVTFDGTSKVTFSDNMAKYGGVIYSIEDSNISLDGNSNVTYSGNVASINGGAISSNNCSITFDGDSNLRFSNNGAKLGENTFQ